MPPLFSVIIPTFNRPEWTQVAIQSVLGQACSDYELIIVDDGSTDETPEVLRQFSARATLLRQPNAGPGAARNLGIQHASGEYLAFLDSDDCWFPWTLENYRAAIKAHQRPALVLGAPEFVKNDSAPISPPSADLKCQHYPDYYASARDGIWPGAGITVVRRQSLPVGGAFYSCRRINGEDLDLLMSLGAAPGFVHVSEPVSLRCRLHASNESTQIRLSLLGAQRLIESERAGRYPGGRTRACERRTLLTRFLRPISFAALRSADINDAWRIYRQTWWWNARLRRVRYLAGFPLVAMKLFPTPSITT